VMSWWWLHCHSRCQRQSPCYDGLQQLGADTRGHTLDSHLHEAPAHQVNQGRQVLPTSCSMHDMWKRQVKPLPITQPTHQLRHVLSGHTQMHLYKGALGLCSSLQDRGLDRPALKELRC
jgi:hypothetical protein